MSAGSAADTSSGVDRGKKKPGQVRRDHQRRTSFLERLRQAAAFEKEARTNEVREEVVGKSGEVDSFCILLSLFGTNFEIGSAMQSFFNFVHVFHKTKKICQNIQVLWLGHKIPSWRKPQTYLQPKFHSPS